MTNKLNFTEPITIETFEEHIVNWSNWNEYYRIQIKREHFLVIRSLKDGNGRLYLDLMEDGKYYLFGKEIEVV